MLFAGFGFSLVYVLIALLIAGSVHEASHALVAHWLGDPTPRQLGRLSLNPLVHLDPLGAVMILTAGLGWFRPVPIRAENLRPGPKLGMALVALAGPVSNFLLAALLALPLRFHLLPYVPEPVFVFGEFRLFVSVGCVVETVLSLSLALAFFNLLPISPLDGSRLWQVILPDRWYWWYTRYEVLGVFIIVGLILTDRFLGTDVLGRYLFPALQGVWQPLVGFSRPFSCVGAF